MAQRYKVVGLGEILWDMLPAGKQLGGAPANFAYISSLLGSDGIVASRIGNDSLGNEAVQRLAALGVTTEFVECDTAHPTGVVQVKVDHAGQPTFVIAENSAWDFLEWTSGWQTLAQRADAICFGSLARFGIDDPKHRPGIRRGLQGLAKLLFDDFLYSPDHFTGPSAAVGAWQL